MLTPSLLLFVVFCVAHAAPPPLPQGASSDQEVLDEVAQLNQLRQSSGANGLMVMKTERTQLSNVNGQVHRSSQKEDMVKDPVRNQVISDVRQQMEVSQAGPGQKPHSVTKTEIHVPSQGIHQATVEDSDVPGGRQMVEEQQKKSSEGWDRQQDKSEDYYSKYSGIQYSPSDLADYILRTGDEEGVAMAIEELLRVGMFSRSEAISYLQDVKWELRHLRLLQQQEQQPVADMAIKRTNTDQTQPKQSRQEAPKKPTVPNTPQGISHNAKTTAEPHPMVSKALHTGVDQAYPPSAAVTPTQATVKAVSPEGTVGSVQRRFQQHEDPDVLAILEKLKTANSLTEEFSLEDIIYQLAKDMFMQSILRGDPTAEDSLTRFAAFLETEVARRRISRDMEQKVLDIVSTALVDSLKEYPGLFAQSRSAMMDPDGPVGYLPLGLESTGGRSAEVPSRPIGRDLGNNNIHKVPLKAQKTAPSHNTQTA